MANWYEEDGKHFGKFFLLNDEVNLNIWQVTPESIPIYMKTFIGQPFVEEPNLEHFGAQNMETHEIIREQEQYRKGTIVAVHHKETEASGVVEVHDDDLWERMKKGEVLHVSPAIAGFAHIQADGTKLYKQWFGLHLAHVKNPAYGVLHASIQKTCEGTEKECIQRLTSIASDQNISFNPLDDSPCKMAEQKMDDKEKDMATTIASLTEGLANMQKSIAAMEDDKKKNDMAMDEEKKKNEVAGQSGSNQVGEPSPIPGKEKQKGTASTAAMQAEIAELTARLAANDDEDKGKMVDEMIAMMKDDDMAMDEDMKEKEMKNDKASIATKLQTAQAYHARIGLTKNPALASGPGRVVAVAAYDANTSKKVSHEQIRGTLP